MSKTSQENKAKKAKLAVEAPTVEEQKAQETPVENIKTDTEADQTTDTVTTKTRQAKIRGKNYQTVKKLVNVNQYYPLSQAVKLVKKVSISKFGGKVEAHLTVSDIGNLGEISFPHLQTTAKKIIVVNDTVLKDIKAGKIEFDILVATPATMPKLLPFAKILGPKGLMPNPKNGTLTDNPESALKKLSVAKTQIKTEKKAPVVHLVVGQISQPEKEIEANIKELIATIGINKIKKLSLCPTMGPSVKVEIVK